MRRLLAAVLVATLLSGCSAQWLSQQVVALENWLREEPASSAPAAEEPAQELPQEPPQEPPQAPPEDRLEEDSQLPRQAASPQEAPSATREEPLSEERYGYRSLGENDQALYRKIVDAVESYTNFVDVAQPPTSREALAKVFQYYVQDHPEHFWLSKSYQYRFYDTAPDQPVLLVLNYYDGQVTDQVGKGREMAVTASRERIALQRKDFDAKLALWLEKLPPGAAAEEKEQLVHDMVVENIRYDSATASSLDLKSGVDSHSFSVYGALMEGLAVCEGYSELFQLLLLQSGVECLTAIGTSRGQPHQWNVVRLGDGYYHVDPTWDDTDIFNDIDLGCYYYFNLSDQQISRDHVIGGSSFYGYPLPACGDGSRSYYEQTALMVKNGVLAESAVQRLNAQVDQRSKWLLIMFDNKPDNAYLQEWINDHIWHTGGLIEQTLATRPEQVRAGTSYYTVENWGMAIIPLEYAP